MHDIAIIVASILGGGLVGAFLIEWFRRRRVRVHAIQLIERVNRQVSPELRGLTVARVVETPTDRKLEELKNLREYHFTMRNASPVTLKDAEVQFEFPAGDVYAWASRPVLSTAALVEVEATATLPWKKAFRWIIPHFPTGDSVEFTFRAVEPSSDSYEAVLYNSGGMVFERLSGEPRLGREATISHVIEFAYFAGVLAFALFVALAFQGKTNVLHTSPVSPSVAEKHALPENVTAIKLAGCNLSVSSWVDRGHEGAWMVEREIINLGAQACVIQSEKMGPMTPFNVEPNRKWNEEKYSEGEPKLVDAEISVHGGDASPATTTVPVYVVP